MLDLNNLPQGGNVQIFTGTRAATSGQNWQVWNKPRGCSQVFIFLVGHGGAGGNGAVGAASTAAGGGGGGSGSQSIVMINANLIPDVLYLNLVGGPETSITATRSYVSIYPDTTANNQLIIANGGGSGGNASGATAGTAGAAGSNASVAVMPLCGMGTYSFLAGQGGIAGGTTGAGAALTLPTTGLVITGGTGGAGIGAAGSTGAAGGAFTVAGIFPPQAGGAAAGSTTGSGVGGSNGFQAVRNLLYFYGGTGGGSSGGAGGSGGRGGAGAYGCGGGGGGGCFTGGTAGVGGKGGDSLCIIVAW